MERENSISEEDYPIVIKVCSILRWVIVGFAILSLIISIIMIFQGFRWYFVVPGYLVLNIFFGILKDYFIGIVEKYNNQQDKLAQQTF